MAVGDSENDTAMLNRVAEAGGFAVCVGEGHRGLSPRVFVLPVKNAPGTFTLLQEHIRAMTEAADRAAAAQVRKTLETVRPELMAALNREFAGEIRMRGGFHLCRETSFILARLLSATMKLPIGGDAPDRIELMSGAVTDKQGKIIELHRWIAVYRGGRKAVLVDGTYAQFDETFTGEYLIGPYAATAYAHRFLEWDEILAYEFERYKQFGATRDEILANLDRSYRSQKAIEAATPPPSLLYVHEISGLVNDIRTGKAVDADLASSRQQARLNAIVEALLAAYAARQAAPAVPAAPVPGPGRMADRLVQDTLLPAGLPREITTAVCDAALPDERMWLAQYASACRGATLAAVCPVLRSGDLERLARLRAMGMNPVALTAGPAPAEAAIVCYLLLTLPGEPKPLKITVRRAPRRADAAEILYLDHPYLAGTASLEAALRARLFGRAVLALWQRAADDDAVAAQLGLDAGRRVPGIVELHGTGAVFAHPGVVNDEFSGRFADSVFSFLPDAPGGLRRITEAAGAAAGLDRAYAADVSADDQIDLTALGFLACDTSDADAAAVRAYPWLTGARTPACYGNTVPAELQRQLQRYAAALAAKNAPSVMRGKPNFAVRFTLGQQRSVPDVNDQGRGTAADLAGHLDELKAAMVDTVQIQALLDADEPFALDLSIVDRAAVPEIRDDEALRREVSSESPVPGRIARAREARKDRDLMRQGYALLRRMPDSRRAAAFEQFYDDHKAWLAAGAAAAARHDGQAGDAGTAREYAYGQFNAYTQLAAAVKDAHARHARLLFDISLKPGADTAHAAAAIAHWTRFGFDGVRIEAAPSDLSYAWLAALTAQVRAINPDAVVVLAPAGDAGELRQYGPRLGCKIVERCAPGMVPAGSVDNDTWLEMVVPEGQQLNVSDEDRLRAWVQALVDSDAGYVAIPDALRWGGAVGEGPDFRNPTRGARLFDISDALCDMLKRRMATARRHELCGWRYRSGLEDGRTIALPGADVIDWAGLAKVRHFALGSAAAGEIAAPGLHCVRAVLDRVRGGGEAEREAVRFHAERRDFFVLVYAIFRETKGLREAEWPAGWQYIRDLDKRARAATDPDARAGYNLQLLEFAAGAADALVEQKYCAAGLGRDSRVPAGEGDRALFRTLLHWADAQGLFETALPGRDGLPDVLAPYLRTKIAADERGVWSPVLGMLDAPAGTGGTQALRQAGQRCALAGDSRSQAVVTALYAKAYLQVYGDRRSAVDMAPELRRVLLQLAAAVGEPASGPASSVERAAHAWAVDELLGLFEIFNDNGQSRLLEESVDAFQGAVNVLSSKRIEQAG
jgi:hypothetical protein